MKVEVCPKCGGILLDIMIATYPGIPSKSCLNCGWSWVGQPEEIEFVPFNDPKELQLCRDY